MSIDAWSTAAATWAALVPAMATTRGMRVSRDGGGTYKRRGVRAVSAELPNQPAAILIYDTDGCTRLLCLDLDVSRGATAAEAGQVAVDRDFASLCAIFSEAGLQWISDRSPTGGRHLYVPLAEPVSFHEARRVTVALTGLASTLDPMPMSGLDSGCIRPPGSRHRSGGYQVLDGSLKVAQRLLAAPNSPAAWRRLVDIIDAHPRCSVAQPAESAAPGRKGGQTDLQAGRLSALVGFSEPDQRFQAIARTGEYPERYRSDSEARQGVIWSCAAAGWALVDVARRLEDGTWPGLASFYARYAPRHRRQALLRDWRSALSHEKRRREARGLESVRLRTTSPTKTQPGGAVRGVQVGPPAPGGAAGLSVAPEATVRQYVSGWLAVVDHLASLGRLELLDRAVLYAMAEAAIKTGDTVVEFGNRSLAIATGMDQSSVGRSLRRLSEAHASVGLLDLVRPARHVRAASYRLLVPPELEDLAATRPWRRGRIHGVRPAFRELGLPAAFVYAVLEQATTPLTGRQVAERAHLGPTATYDALALLAAHDLARSPTRTGDSAGAGWTRGTASLAQLAEAWGVLDDVRAQLQRYRAERQAWWAYLGVVRLDAPGTYQATASPPDSLDTGTHPGAHSSWTSRTDDDVGSLLDLLERELGATVIDGVA